jgi:hypothetical protein
MTTWGDRETMIEVVVPEYMLRTIDTASGGMPSPGMMVKRRSCRIVLNAEEKSTYRYARV